MKIINNAPALNAYNSLSSVNSALSKSIRRLSSGLRINSAADDAAGLAISEKMRGQIKGLDQAVRNSQDGISMIQTAEGALNEGSSILQRMRELAVQAANDTLTSNDRQYIQLEVEELKSELDRISNTTQFNKRKLLDGSSDVLWSSSDLSTRALVRGGIDNSESGNYKISFQTLDTGQSQILKTNMFQAWNDGDEATLRDINQFYDNGRFMFDSPKTLQMSMIDGKSTSLIIYGNETVEELRRKINDSIAYGLNQAELVGNDIMNFCSISSGVPGTSESILYEEQTNFGLELLKSKVVNGGAMTNHNSGAIYFAAISAGSQNVELFLNDFGINDTIQIFTRDGKHIAGTLPDGDWPNGSTTPAGVQASMITDANGFLPGAVYDSTHLNGIGGNLPFNINATNNGSANKFVYNGMNIEYSGDGNPGSAAGNSNEYLKIDVATEHLIVFVTGKGAFGFGGKWDTMPDVKGDYTMQAPLLVRSAIPGEAGKIHFSGDEDILKALGFNTIQEARESTFNVSVSDAHSGQPISNNIKVSGNTAYSVIGNKIDVAFDPLTNMKVTWNDISKRFDFAAKAAISDTFLHLVNNSATLQIGANEGEDIVISFGDMSSRALGVNKVLLTDGKLAARSITIIDNAIDIVSSHRARLGAYQNRLEHTTNSLSLTAENLTASESRIRDLDMAKEMIEFTKLQILLQSGQSMLSQSNQLPQAVLSLLR